MRSRLKSEFVRARIAPALKTEAEYVLDQMGITPTQAITMLYKAVAREHEWPLELKVPKPKTRRALEESERGIGIVKCKSVADMFKKLGIGDAKDSL